MVVGDESDEGVESDESDESDEIRSKFPEEPIRDRTKSKKAAEHLVGLRVLSKSTAIKKEFFYLNASSRRGVVEFSLDFHRDDPELCVCKTGFRPKCLAWTEVEIIKVNLLFDDKHEERTTFALLKGDGTALRLKMKIHAPGSSEFMSVFNIAGNEDDTVICKARTQIFPVDMRTVSIDTIGDDEVAEDEGNGSQTFKDILEKGKITAEVWSVVNEEESDENASSSDNSESDSSQGEEWNGSDEETSFGATRKKSKKRKDLPESIDSDEYEEIGEELEVQEKPVNEKHRKIGYLEFKKPRKNHAPSAAALAWQEEQGVNWLKKKQAKTKHKNIEDDDDFFKPYRYVRQELLTELSVVARRVEQLVRNAIERHYFKFFEDLCEKGVNLPDSTVLEKLGVPLYLIEKAGLEMTLGQQKRRDKRNETVAIDSEEEGESTENSSDIVRDDSSNINIPCVDNYSESPTEEGTAIAAKTIETAEKEKCKTEMQIRSSSSKRKTVLQRISKQNETVAIDSEEEGESTENSSDIVRDNSSNINIPCVHNYSESSTEEGTAIAAKTIETAEKEKCKTDMQIRSSSSKGKTVLKRISDAETQVLSGNRCQRTSILDCTQSTSIPPNLHSRVKIMEEAMGSSEEKNPVSEKLILKLSKLEKCIDTMKLRISKLEEEIFEQVSISQRIESLPRRLDRVEKELGNSQNGCDIMTRVCKLESVLL